MPLHNKHRRWQKHGWQQCIVLPFFTTFKPQLKCRLTYRLPVRLPVCFSVASAPPLLPDFPAKWQRVSPWTGSWYQPERPARLINLIDLQWLENKLFEQLCLSDHISLPKSQKAPSLWWTALYVYVCVCGCVCLYICLTCSYAWSGVTRHWFITNLDSSVSALCWFLISWWFFFFFTIASSF